MNTQLKDWFEKQEQIRKSEREKYLVKLGLCEYEVKTYQSYSDVPDNLKEQCGWDNEKQLHYVKEVKNVIDVTEEEYRKILDYSQQEIKINYKGSGVKTLKGFGDFFFVISIIASIVTIIGFIMYLTNEGSYYGEDEAVTGLSLASNFFSVALLSLIGGAILKGLSTIAKTALFQRILLQEKHIFDEN